MRYFLILLLATSALAQTSVTITDNNFAGPLGQSGTWKGTITASQTFKSADGFTVPAGFRQTFTISGNTFSVHVVPNAGSTPTPTFYNVSFSQVSGGGGGFSEQWCVPASPISTRADVVCNGTLFNFPVLNVPNGGTGRQTLCPAGQTFVSNGTSYDCGTGATPGAAGNTGYTQYNIAGGLAGSPPYHTGAFSAGSSSGGINEAYTTCIATWNACSIIVDNDITMSTNVVTTLSNTQPMYLDGAGHQLSLTCASGVCWTVNATSAGNGAQPTIHNLIIKYTGNAPSSIDGMVRVWGTDYHNFYDNKILGQAQLTYVGANAPTACLILSQAQDGIMQNNVINGCVTGLVLGDSTGNPASQNTFINNQIAFNSKAIKFDWGSIQNVFIRNDISLNGGPTTIDIDATNGSGGEAVFEGNQFFFDGDGTANARTFLFTIPNGKSITQIRISDNVWSTYGSGSIGGLVAGYAYGFALAGSGAIYRLNMSNNVYYGPSWAGIQTGWSAGSSSHGVFSTNESLSVTGGPNVPFGDIIFGGSGSNEAGATFGGSLTASTFTTGGTGVAHSGVIRLKNGDYITVRRTDDSNDIQLIYEDGFNGVIIGNNAAYVGVQGKFGLKGYTQATLPASGNGAGQIVWCSDCTPASNPCTGSGSGSIAVATNSTNWKCY